MQRAWAQGRLPSDSHPPHHGMECVACARCTSGRRHFTSYLIHTIPWMATPPPRLCAAPARLQAVMELAREGCRTISGVMRAALLEHTQRLAVARGITAAV